MALFATAQEALFESRCNPMKLFLNCCLWAFLCLILSSYSLRAATITWNGDGDGVTWIDADNWDTDMVPIATDDVVFLDSVSIDFTSSLNLVTVNNLTIWYGASITINFPLKIDTHLRLESNVPAPGPINLTFNNTLDQNGNTSGWVMSGAMAVLNINFNANAIMRKGEGTPSFSQDITITVATDATVVNTARTRLAEFGSGTPTLRFEGAGNIAINNSFEVFANGTFIKNY